MRLQFLTVAQILALYFAMYENEDVVSISELSDFRSYILKRINNEETRYIIESSNVDFDRAMIDYPDCFGYGQSGKTVVRKTTTNQIIKRIVAYLPNKILHDAFKKDDV